MTPEPNSSRSDDINELERLLADPKTFADLGSSGSRAEFSDRAGQRRTSGRIAYIPPVQGRFYPDDPEALDKLSTHEGVIQTETAKRFVRMNFYHLQNWSGWIYDVLPR